MQQRHPKVGPLVMPWEQTRPEELALFVVAGLVGAIVGATLVYHYRRLRP